MMQHDVINNLLFSVWITKSFLGPQFYISVHISGVNLGAGKGTAPFHYRQKLYHWIIL